MPPDWIVLFDFRDEPAWFGQWPLLVAIAILLAVAAAIAWRAFRNSKERAWTRGDVRVGAFAVASLVVVVTGGTLAIREHANEGRAFANGDYRVAEGVVTDRALTPNGKRLRFDVGKVKFDVGDGFKTLIQDGDYVRVAFVDSSEILRIERRTESGASK